MTRVAKWVIRSGFFAIVALIAAFLAFATPVRAEKNAETLLKAVVGLHVSVPENARTAKGLGTVRRGSGVVIDDKGLILTIGFLIMEAEGVLVTGPEDRPVKADIVAYDWESGFGLLRAREKLDVQPIVLGVSDKLKPRDPVLIAPYGGKDAATPAFVIARREFPGYWEYLLEDAIFTAPLNPMHPGAALLGADGQLLGIGYLALGDVTDSGRVNPGNMFVPIDRLKPILDDLKAHGRSQGPAKPWLGVFTEQQGGRVFVTRVSDDGPAERAGVTPGAIILTVAGAKVRSQAEFYRKVWALGAAGTEVPLTLLEDTDVREVTVRSTDRYDWLRLKHGK